ncbi:hypothetical protein, partial [Flavobacterium sp. XS2P14]|uniref:hypothetical protein n=1 Tax=Flavobacterium sp. XS2P14 TaxID=3401735 RepID=UPI003AB05243
KKNEEYDPNYLQKMNQHQENISKLLKDELDKKNSPNQVETIPDKQIIFENEILSIVEQIYKN